MIIIKGKQSVLEAIHSNIKIHEIFIMASTSSKEFQTIITHAKQHNIPLHLIEKKQFDKKFPLDGHQRIIAHIPDIPIRPLSIITPEKHPIVVVLDHLEDPYNVGAIMRTCECLGINTIIVPKNRQAPLNSGVIKTSSGAAYYLNIIQVANIANALSECTKKGYWIYGLDSNRGMTLSQFKPHLPCVLVVGNEHKGLSTIVKKQLHDPVRLSMKGKISSLNVSVATGIMLHHLSSLL